MIINNNFNKTQKNKQKMKIIIKKIIINIMKNKINLNKYKI